MLGRMSNCVNDRIEPLSLPVRGISFLSASRVLQTVTPLPEELSHVIIPSRLQVYEAVCDLSTGESRD
jgi:hypothetical protein